MIIEGSGGMVGHETTERPAPQWIREFLGDDVFDDVVVTAVCMNAGRGEQRNGGWGEFGDREAKCLQEVPNLISLSLSNTQVSDAGLRHIAGLTNLKLLHLQNTQVSDAGLEHIEGLRNLIFLYLDDTKVSDAGLEQLEKLTNLKMLYLNNTQVTPEGVKKLQEALPNCEIAY